MSVVYVNGVPFKTPDEAGIVTFDGSKYLMVLDGSSWKKMLMSAVATASHDHSGETLDAAVNSVPASTHTYRIIAGSTYLRVNDLSAPVHPGVIDIYAYDTAQINMNGYYIKMTVGHSVQAFGSVFADHFYEWSELSSKENVEPIPNGPLTGLNMRGKQYDLKGEKTRGFVVEEMPAEVIASTDVDGIVKKAINITAVCAYQQEVLLAQEARIAALENKLKGIEETIR